MVWLSGLDSTDWLGRFHVGQQMDGLLVRWDAIRWLRRYGIRSYLGYSHQGGQVDDHNQGTARTRKGRQEDQKD